MALNEKWVRNRDTVTDWGEILVGAQLPREIQPSDIDGIVEINGTFLVMERKKMGEKTRDGQRYLLEALARQSNFTVLEIVHGPDGVEEIYNYGTGKREVSSPSDFIARVEAWADVADNLNRNPMQ